MGVTAHPPADATQHWELVLFMKDATRHWELASNIETRTRSRAGNWLQISQKKGAFRLPQCYFLLRFLPLAS